MPAYVIVDIDVTDPERYEQYKAATPATLADLATAMPLN